MFETLIKYAKKSINLQSVKTVTVEEIHAEFDSAEERILSECDKLLSELQIPTESNIERKADMLVSLGFINSETVEKAKSIKIEKNKIKSIVELTTIQANYIRELKVRYPLEKFITVDELERICNKYNLIHAPSTNYIKDIPEKNVLEMKNAKPLLSKDMHEGKLYWKYIADFRQDSTLNERKKLQEWNDISELRSVSSYNRNNDMCSCHILGKNICVWNSINSETKDVSMNGLFIAAPKSHFNLDGLDKETKFGFFKTEITEIKDPVVYEYCKNNICRIITKWGTDDDQSYLDSALLNETHN